MALLGFEGFDHLITGSNVALDLNNMPGWSGGVSNVNFSKGAGLLGGSCLTIANSGLIVTFTPGGTYSTLICGFRFKAASVTTANSIILAFADAGTAQVGIATDGSGHLFLWRGTTATVIATGTTVLVANSWYFIELKVTFNNAGSYELRINETTEISGSADTTNTANNYATQANIRGVGVPGGFSFDDFYLCDDSGPAPHNTFLGKVRVETLFPSSDNSAGFTPLSSTNTSNVDEANFDSDTTYNSASASATDLFNMGDLSSTPSTVFAVGVVSGYRKDDVTALSFRNKLKSGGTTSSGATVSPVTVYQYTKDTYTTDPDTGVAWTGSGVNAAIAGYERI